MSAHVKSIRRAQRATLDVVKDLLDLDQRLYEIAEGIPLRFGTDDMLEGDVPFDVGFDLHGRLQRIRRDELAGLLEQVREAASVSQEDLDRTFVQRKRRDVEFEATRGHRQQPPATVG